MTERSANDITTPARLVLDAYIIDPVTKLPMAPGVASNGATAAKQDEQTDLLEAIQSSVADRTTPSQVKGQVVIANATPVLDTSAYTANNVLFATVAIENLAPAKEQAVVLESISVIDKDDVGPQITLHFFDANVALGTVNTPPSISGGDAVNYLGSVDIAAADWRDLGGVKVVERKGIALNLNPASGSRSVYVAGTTTGTPTFTSTEALILRFGVLG